jgi:hypothetical protein
MALDACAESSPPISDNPLSGSVNPLEKIKVDYKSGKYYLDLA